MSMKGSLRTRKRRSRCIDRGTPLRVVHWGTRLGTAARFVCINFFGHCSPRTHVDLYDHDIIDKFLSSAVGVSSDQGLQGPAERR
jgi:hypothetical protein